MDPHGLDTSQLSYELLMRHMPATGTARYRAIVVADQLQLEQSGQIPRNHLENSPYTIRHDLQECENLCRFLEGAAENRHIDSMALRTYLSKTAHLVARIRRIRTATQEQRSCQRDIMRRMTMVRYEFRRQQNPDDVSLLLEGLSFNEFLVDDQMQPPASDQPYTSTQESAAAVGLTMPEPNPTIKSDPLPIIGHANLHPLATSSAKIVATNTKSTMLAEQRNKRSPILRQSLLNWRQPARTPSPSCVDESFHSKDPASATNLTSREMSKPTPVMARNSAVSATQFGPTNANSREANAHYSGEDLDGLSRFLASTESVWSRPIPSATERINETPNASRPVPNTIRSTPRPRNSANIRNPMTTVGEPRTRTSVSTGVVYTHPPAVTATVQMGNPTNAAAQWTSPGQQWQAQSGQIAQPNCGIYTMHPMYPQLPAHPPYYGRTMGPQPLPFPFAHEQPFVQGNVMPRRSGIHIEEVNTTNEGEQERNETRRTVGAANTTRAGNRHRDSDEDNDQFHGNHRYDSRTTGRRNSENDRNTWRRRTTTRPPSPSDSSSSTSDSTSRSNSEGGSHDRRQRRRDGDDSPPSSSSSEGGHHRRRRRHRSHGRNTNQRVVPVNHWRISFSGEANSSNKFDLNIHKFLQQVKLFRRASNISRGELLRQIIHLLNGSARDWYQNASRTINTWGQFVVALKAKFLPTDYNFQLMAQAQRRQQDKNESVAQYINAMEMIFSSMSRHIDPEWQLTVVCANLLPQYSDLVVAQAPQSIAEIEAICKRLESAKEHKKYFTPQAQTSKQYPHRPKVFAAEEDNPVSTSDNDGEESEANVCAVVRRSDNKKKTPAKKPFAKDGEKPNGSARVDASAEAGRVIVCFNCDGSGHVHKDCPSEKRVFCYNCGTKRVTAKDCPKCSTRTPKNGQANLIDLEQQDSSPASAAN